MESLETERLTFRERSPEVIQEVLHMSFDEQLKFFGFTDTKVLERTLSRLGKNKPQKYFELLEKSSGLVIGSAGFHTWFPEHERAEIGYGLHAPFQGKGYMKEALKQMLRIGFFDMKLNRIEAFVGTQNKASNGLMQLFGFQKEGVLRQHYKNNDVIEDSAAYSLLKSEFLERNI